MNPNRKILSVLAIAVAATPMPASAHVKWFCHYDVTQTPAAFDNVITPNFLACLGAFVSILFLGLLADGWIARRWPTLVSTGATWEGAADKLIRVAIGAFFLCGWNAGGTILTPELKTQAAFVGAIQFAVAVFVIWRLTCIVSALGIGALYVYGIAQYGIFHMLDYVYFPGLAVYLALISLRSTGMSRWRAPLLTGSLAFSLIWTALEKMYYPQWSHQLMAKHGQMMMGLHFKLFIVIAAFVEFTLAFYLATGRGLLRLGAIALLAVFISAMPEFGYLDVVGHFTIIGILGVSLLEGASQLQNTLRLPHRGIVLNAGAIVVLYVVALGTFLGLYYSVWWMEYG